MEITLNDIAVMFVQSPNGPAGSGEAFNILERRLPNLKGRKFYATFQYSTGEYRACMAIQDDHQPKQLGFDVWTIPGGRYAQEKLTDWTQHADEIPTVFQRLSEEFKDRIDSSRPSIEYYKSQKELLLLLPVR